MKGTYLDQTKRIVRSFNRLSKQNILERITDKIKDDNYHFFQDCFHLKDWIKNDSDLPQIMRDEVENFVERSRFLKHVADIANATKHLQLTKYIRVDKEIDFEILNVTSDNEHKEMLSIKSKNESFGGNSLHINALKDWNRFLGKYKLGMFDFKSKKLKSSRLL